MKLKHKTKTKPYSHSKEMFIQGIMLGFLIGTLYLAIFSTILERL
jgi:F0F1-type ATP synthase assembly protein I